VIGIDGLAKQYGDKTVGDGLSFVPGMVTGFLGPNGAVVPRYGRPGWR
jgi:ABC-type multidrug transport system ATPase subunit